jgi:hypothetical protein
VRGNNIWTVKEATNFAIALPDRVRRFRNRPMEHRTSHAANNLFNLSKLGV